MATYKVLQDIEAEDKFLGPLTLKQFILACVAGVSAYLGVFLITKGVWVLTFPLVPVIIVTAFLAFPWGRDQPTETWLLAKIRFYFKPRVRIWDQSGVQELVKITAPVRIEEVVTDNLDQTELKSRLRALADTIDSRGWATKGVARQDQASDRLVEAAILPSVQPEADVEDMFESGLSRSIGDKISQNETQHKQRIINSMQNAGQPQNDTNNFWFMNQKASTDLPTGYAQFGTQNAAPAAQTPALSAAFSGKSAMSDTNDEDQALLQQIKQNKRQQSLGLRNHKSINPNTGNTAPVEQKPPMTTVANPAIINLARSNDRTVESIAREANDEEVVISLH